MEEKNILETNYVLKPFCEKDEELFKKQETPGPPQGHLETMFKNLVNPIRRDYPPSPHRQR